MLQGGKEQKKLSGPINGFRSLLIKKRKSATVDLRTKVLIYNLTKVRSSVFCLDALSV